MISAMIILLSYAYLGGENIFNDQYDRKLMKNSNLFESMNF